MKKVFPQALVFLVACSNSASDNEPGTNLGATQLWARSDVQMPGDEMGLGSWPIEIIYPAAGAGHSLTYIDNPVILEAMIEAEYYDVAPPELRGWGERQAPFKQDPLPQARQEALPLIVLIPGLGVSRYNYRLLASKIVSNGFIVAVVPLRYLTMEVDEAGTLFSPSQLGAVQSENPEDLRPLIAQWVRDLSSSIDVILERADQLNIDPERIATIGHSLGGAIALDTCHADDRIDFCIDFEGAPFSTRTLDSGPGGPSLIVLSRAVYPEETRDANNGPGTFLLEMLNKGDEPGWFAEVAGGGHMSFSDAPHAMPETINRFGGEVMSAERSDEVYIALLAGMAKAIWGLSQFNSLDVVANSFEEVDLSTPDANEAPRND